VTATDEYAPTFALVDADQDGYISLDEFTHLMELLGGDRATEQAVESMFGQMDSDGDGKVDLAELSTFLQASAG